MTTTEPCACSPRPGPPARGPARGRQHVGQETTLKDLLGKQHVVVIKHKWYAHKTEQWMGDWLQKSFVERGNVLVRRQDLPHQAVLDAAEHKRRRGAELGDLCDIADVAVISHSWLAPGHPDPFGKRRADISVVDKPFLFWDFLSLHQVDRTGKRQGHEEISFRIALASMHKIYSCPKWCVYRIVTVPPDAENNTPYKERGWCVFETSMAVAAKALVTVKDGIVVVTEPTPMPMTPSSFALTLKNLHFTSKNADSSVVLSLFGRMVPCVEKIRFGSWGDEQLLQFKELLPEFSAVKIVKVSNWEDSCTAQLSDAAMRTLNGALAERGGELRVAYTDGDKSMMWKGGKRMPYNKKQFNK